MKRITDRIQLILVCALVPAFLAAFVILPDKSLSQAENRTLAAFPAFSISRLFSGEFTAELGEYFADQFPLRDAFVSVKAYSELALGKLENNGVVYAKEQTLITRPQTEEGRLERNLRSVAAFADAVDIPVTVAALPRTADVFPHLLPACYPAEADLAVWEEYGRLCAELGLTAPDLYTPLGESGQYYRTDHHYTTHGAFIAYEQLGGALGYEAYPADFFTVEQVSDDFCGTSARTSGFYGTEPDVIELYRYDGDDGYTVTADGQSISLYDFDALVTTDKYAVFLGGNHARVDITCGTDRPRLLLIRDSFADSIAPFLALHYDLTLIDLRYYTGNVYQLTVEEEFSAVMVYESMNELTSGNLAYLNVIKEVQ